MKRFVAAVFLTLIVASPLLAQRQEKPVLALSCTAEKVTLTQGESVNLTVHLENRGSSDFYVYRTLEWGWAEPLAIRPLVLLGQSSLQVFCVHLLFCFAGLTLMGSASMLNGWRQFALLSVTFTAMLITAKIFAKAEAKNERQAKTEGSSEPGAGTNWRVPSGPAARETVG
jgi:hypothetical protein